MEETQREAEIGTFKESSSSYRCKEGRMGKNKVRKRRGGKRRGNEGKQ